MFSQKMSYYAEEPIFSALSACHNAIFNELSTENAMNFSNNVELIKIESELTNELKDSEIFVDEKNLQEMVKSWLNDLDLIAANIFLPDLEITEKIDKLIAEKETKFCFSLKLNREANSETLFNVLYATIRFAQKDDLNCIAENEQIEYVDYDYSDFTEMITSALSEYDEIEAAIFSHTSRETQSTEEFIDFYYTIRYNI
jgi:hypothetical protein